MLQVKVIDICKIGYEKVPEPIMNSGEAIVDIASVGICGSDIHVFKGENPVLKPPLVQGHEFGGTISSISNLGREKNIKINKKVAVFPIINCGACFYCTKGLDHLCENQMIFDGGIFDGAMKEKIAVPIKNLVLLPDSFDLIYSSLIEPVAVAVHVADKIRSSNILIIGVGTIGLLIQQICKKNKNTVITLDINDNSLKNSSSLGADLVCDYLDPGCQKEINNFLGSKKIDIVIDCVGKENTLKSATDLVRKKGEVILVGVPKSNLKVDVVGILLKEITLKGSYIYSIKDFLIAKQYVVGGLVDLKKLDLKIFPLTKAEEGYKYKINNPSKKVLLVNNYREES